METIICSAIWYGDLPTPAYRPINIDEGIVFCGHRHMHCLHQMVIMTGKKQSEAGREIQGFLTNKNRFIDREEAVKIAKKANQLIREVNPKMLFSEDIY